MRSRPTSTVLMYHRLSDAVLRDEEALYTVSPVRFEEQMRALASSGRDVVGTNAFVGRSHPDRAVAITFDDGCSSDYAVALPILKSLGLTAAFFVNPALVGQEGFLTWEQVGRIASEGMTVGSHGLDHRPFDGLAPKELERQLAESKALLERRLGIEITTLSLPGGSGAETAPAVARRLGYRLVFGSEPSVTCAGNGVLPRFAIRRRETARSLLALVRQRPLRLARETARHRLLATLRRRTSPEVYRSIRDFVFRRVAERNGVLRP